MFVTVKGRSLVFYGVPGRSEDTAVGRFTVKNETGLLAFLKALPAGTHLSCSSDLDRTTATATALSKLLDRTWTAACAA